MQLNKFKKKFQNFQKNNYQNSAINLSEFKIREKIKKKILNLNRKKISNVCFCKSCTFFKKEFKNKKKIIIYYKKFSSNLNLKFMYNKFFKKISEQNACPEVLQKLSIRIFQLNKINTLQKLNSILKINDIFIIQFLENKKLPHLVKKNFHIENNLLKKII